MKAPLSKKVRILIKKGHGYALVEKVRNYEHTLSTKKSSENVSENDAQIGEYRLVLSK